MDRLAKKFPVWFCYVVKENVVQTVMEVALNVPTATDGFTGILNYFTLH